MSVTSRKSAGPARARFRADRGASPRSDRGAISLQATGRCNTGYQVLLRTPAAKQKSMSLQDNQNIHQSISCKLEFRLGGAGVLVGWGAEENYTKLHDMAGDTSTEEIQDVSCVGLRT